MAAARQKTTAGLDFDASPDGNSSGNSEHNSAIRTAIRGQFKATRARLRQIAFVQKLKTWEIRQFGPPVVCLLKF